MSELKTQKLSTYSSVSLLASNDKPPTPELVRFEYKIEESESTALESIFNQLCELAEKELNSCRSQ
jgi:hypothetical protein